MSDRENRVSMKIRAPAEFAHNPEVVGSNPTPAICETTGGLA